MQRTWQIRTDTGGTFTDCLAFDPAGKEHRLKLLSSGALRACLSARPTENGWLDTDGLPVMDDGFFAGFTLRHLSDGSVFSVEDSRATRIRLAGSRPPSWKPGDLVELGTGEEAPVLAARLLTGTRPGADFPPVDMRIATTRGTNALLEQRGAPVVLFITEGFEDLPLIGDQRRPDLFALAPSLPPPLHVASIGVPGRLDARGEVLDPIDLPVLAERATAALARHPGASAAVALMHASRNPAHEEAARTVLRACGFAHVAVSSDLAPFIKLLPRAQTAIVEATLAPVLQGFLHGVRKPLGQAVQTLWMMSSAGGIESADRFRAKDGLLSGPAGGAVGAAAIARSLGWNKVLTLDMGGTSTDVARMDGGFSYQFDHQVGGARLLFPSVKIETIAAGGGSICQWADGRLQVGPRSAGADPGPACYGKGGPLTVTDLNLLLGHFDPDAAPLPIRREPAEARLAELAETVARATGSPVEPLALARDLRALAIESLADAIRSISIREGVDPSDHALLAFGGAGPQHACEVADILGISRVCVPGPAGLLSAFGLHHAPIERLAEKQILLPLKEIFTQIASIVSTLEARAIGEIRRDVPHHPDIAITRRMADLRLAGQDQTISVEVTEPEHIERDFHDSYVNLYHYPPPDRVLEVVALRVMATARPAPLPDESLSPARAFGPDLLQDGFSTCVIPSGWSYRRGDRGSLVLEKGTPDGTDTPPVAEASVQAVQTELFRARFAAVVGEMGTLLVRTALSTNIKERLDFSCALLDPGGRLVLNAPHIPVHLGALGLCVRSVAASLDFHPGDVAVTNHPAHGGSHLPDVTLLGPVHDASGTLVGWVANRAHHAEIGGLTPGSMPPDATHLAEEGVVIAPRWLVRDGQTDWDGVESLLRLSPWPSRNPAENLADLQAQLSALLHARAAMTTLANRHGTPTLHRAMDTISRQSATAFREALDRFDWSGPRHGEEIFDDGTRIAVEIRRDPATRHLTIDFSGSSPQHPRNFNATPAIAISSVIYVLRLLVGGDLPLNDGLMADTTLIIKEGGVVSPRFAESAESCPPVVAGNVETSQHLVHALLKAFGVAACSQGTMNNVLFGDGRFAHYETLGGGGGATHGTPGISGRHTHMTNTAITDPEVLESRFPVRLTRFSLRPGSGGTGRFPGGCGLVREYLFLAPLTVSILSSKRRTGPEGADGGGPGATGRNRLLSVGTTYWRDLGGVAALTVHPGDRLRIETPGGGGWGTP